MEVEADCPYCGEPIAFWVDAGGGSDQSYIEDCAVCCKPIVVRVIAGEDGEPSVIARRQDD